MTDKFDLIDLNSRRPSLSQQAHDSLRAALTSHSPELQLDADVAERYEVKSIDSRRGQKIAQRLFLSLAG